MVFFCIKKVGEIFCVLFLVNLCQLCSTEGTLLKVQLPSSNSFLAAKGVNPSHSIWQICLPLRPPSLLLFWSLQYQNNFQSNYVNQGRCSTFNQKDTCYRGEKMLRKVKIRSQQCLSGCSGTLDDFLFLSHSTTKVRLAFSVQLRKWQQGWYYALLMKWLVDLYFLEPGKPANFFMWLGFIVSAELEGFHSE